MKYYWTALKQKHILIVLLTRRKIYVSVLKTRCKNVLHISKHGVHTQIPLPCSKARVPVPAVKMRKTFSVAFSLLLYFGKIFFKKIPQKYKKC
jgi:hypothetical protein